MYRDGKQIASTDVHNFVFGNAALGDMISSLPAVVFARKFYVAGLKMVLWVPPWQQDLVAHLLAPYGEFEYRDLMAFPKKHKDRKHLGPISYNFCVSDQHTRCRVHMVDYAFGFLLNARPESMEQRCYPNAAPISAPTALAKIGFTNSDGVTPLGKYVVFPVGATSDNKLFHASVMGPIMSWCLEHGYRPVIVGSKTSHTSTTIDGELKPIVLREQTSLLPDTLLRECQDMREKTTLLELRDILGHAAAVVGVDGGTLHLAGTTDVPIVFASGTTLPKHRYIARHGSPSYRARYVGPRDLECTGCQSNWPMTTFHFTRCAYEDNACMTKLHPDDFINGLRELGL